MSQEITTERIHVDVSDGTKMMVYISRPKNAKGPGIFVLQEAFGVDKHIRGVADRLAKEGFVAAAPELFHRTAAEGSELSYDNFPAVMPHFKALTPQLSEADLKATYDWLTSQSFTDKNKMATIGFCLGGRLSFLANAKFPLKAAVSYYGGGIAPDMLSMAKDQHGPILFFWGGKDAHIGVEQPQQVAAALRETKKSFVNVEMADADHGFFNENKSVYNKKAADESWALSLAFLKNNL